VVFDLAFHRRVRDGFLEMARAEPDRFRVIDTRADADDVFAKVLAAAT
jgi:dTMP kinase